MEQRIIQHVRFDERGLIPAVIQDSRTNEVIGFRYLDNTILAATLKSGKASFSLENSEARIEYALSDVKVNVDGASITVVVEREESQSSEKPLSLLRDLGEAHRTGGSEVAIVDVGSMEFGLTLNDLYSLIADRKDKRPEGSYTTYLFNSGLDKILKKIAEESGELIIAAKNASHREITSELADLFYHMLVLMVERDVRLKDVDDELAKRASQAPPHPEQD